VRGVGPREHHGQRDGGKEGEGLEEVAVGALGAGGRAAYGFQRPVAVAEVPGNTALPGGQGGG